MLTLALNVMVALSKIVLGIVTGALAITADGFHSLIDGSSNVVALVANRIADRPPDDDHPYGHRRFETIAALAIGGFLVLTAWEIVSSALERLGGGGAAPDITPLSFTVMLATLGVNLFVTLYEAHEGQRLNSELLTADAAHTRADVAVTISVLISMALIALLGWEWADTVAALVIVVLILRAAWQVLKQTGSVLVDTAPYSPEQLTSLVKEVPAVDRVLRARSRGSTDAAYIDIDVQVAPEMTADHTAALESAIREKLTSRLSGVSEIEVHFVPEQNGEHDYALTARACADALGLTTHEVRVSHGESGKVLEMHVEVPPGETLEAAHQQVSQLELNVKKSLNDIADVVTHIEPALNDALSPDTGLLDQSRALKAQALKLLKTRFLEADWHHLYVYPTDGGFVLTLHVILPPQISIESAHSIAESAEMLLRSEMPQLYRVIIHTEPPDSGD
jgi:cation diffusion facilitator family transporter